jgi:TolB-like protein/DNA-binding winged helix-turn-helix (wHTH) protein/Tfp pilus assembly protein PilF
VLPLTSEIQGPAGSVHLEPKVMEVLVALARQPGHVVERDTLLSEVWGARGAVSDEPLTRCIAELRRALGDSPRAPSFIQTIPKRGYRLICEAGPLEQPGARLPALEATAAETSSMTGAVLRPAALETASTGNRLGRRNAKIAGAGVLLLAFVATGITLLTDRLPSPVADDAARAGAIAPNTIAVLPFANVGDAPDDSHFSEGLADEILNRLSKVPGLRVVARTSSFAFRNQDLDIRSIAERLRVAYVLEGSVRRSGDDMRIAVQLVDADRGYQLWSETYDGEIGEIFPVQDAIANTIVTRLHDVVPGLPQQAAINTRAPTDDPAAYELLLRGRQQLNRRDEQSLRRSIALFTDAIERDPGFGQAYTDLATAYVLLPSYSSELPDEMYDMAMATLAAGIEHDESVRQAMQGLLALIAYSRWDWSAAEIAFRSALEQPGSNSDVLVWYSQFLSSVGRPAESLQQAQRAKEIDLLSPVVNHRLSVAYMWVDEDAEAMRYSDLAAELGMGPAANPDSYVVLKLRAGDYAAVRPMLIGVQTMFAQPTAWVDALLEAFVSPQQRAQAVTALAGAERSRDIARKYLFGAWVYLGETERALETALQLTHDRPSLSVEFLFSREAEALRRHPRFAELVRTIGLNRYWDQFGWPEMCRRNGEEIVCR